MKRSVRGIALLWCFLLVTGLAKAAEFEPVFLILDVDGRTSIQPAGESMPGPIKIGGTYTYGTRLLLEPKAVVQMQLSPKNKATLTGPAVIIPGEDPNAEQNKDVYVESGKIEVELEDEYQLLNKLTLSTACKIGSTALTGSKFSLEAKTEADMNVSVITSTKGLLSITGRDFLISQLPEGSVISLACSADTSFTRVKVVRGAFPVELSSGDDMPYTEELLSGTVLKLWRRPNSEGDDAVTILVTEPDGNISRTITFTDPTIDQGPVQPPPEDGEPPTPPDADAVESEEWDQIEPVTTSTTTTTTTTIPEEDRDLDIDVLEILDEVVPSDVTPTGRR